MVTMFFEKVLRFVSVMLLILGSISGIGGIYLTIGERNGSDQWVLLLLFVGCFVVGLVLAWLTSRQERPTGVNESEE